MVFVDLLRNPLLLYQEKQARRRSGFVCSRCGYPFVTNSNAALHRLEPPSGILGLGGPAPGPGRGCLSGGWVAFGLVTGRQIRAVQRAG